ncbi:hypothetical protein TWF696_001142 [Orbilia brochopaga]|uniref:Rhodopsin domain-containing protein n=1 Tax=Orbilia brochopaga TaxID=3140254 RepID=A0AAV9VH27_9PEZI
MQRFAEGIGLEWSMIVVTLLLVLFRLYHRFRYERLALFEDGFVVLAWLCFFSQAVMGTELYRLGFSSNRFESLVGGFNGDTANIKVNKISYAENGTYHFSMYAAKAALLCFYTRFVPTSMTKTRVYMWVTVATVAIGFIVGTILDLFHCLPLSRNWTPNGDCSSGWAFIIAPIVSYTFHLLTDVMVYILPLAVIQSLPVTESRRLGAWIAFTLGFLCICFAVAVTAISYLSTSITVYWIVSVFEQALCICVACAPGFRSHIISYDLKQWKDRISCHREKRRDTDSEAGTATGSISEDEEAGTRPSSDATLVYLDQTGFHQHSEDIGRYYRTDSKRMESTIAYEDIFGSSRLGRSPISIVPVESYTGPPHDPEYQTSSPSSPGYTVSIASIADFYDLERQLQLDDERRQAKNCSPVLERRSSEVQSRLSSETTVEDSDKPR